ncbi:helix-turn-helix domain-containing protein [Lachnobacterium bovis]|uniref:Transcriptional regulator, XRE family with cupin sensor n=1 Tax=Lachnobacterium bovis TaxID=140626 RepID=A0A1H9PWM0_9FIRM|nr:XRE family transcriptional regulator [Lachnobacterium bovis]SER51993.1 transcriptional regulator, XRE family with cupin sensor [Lachnobacterium bovis]
MDIGKRMKELRVLYGLTQQELADRAELTKGFISQLERNQNTPSISTLLDIIQCLGTTPAEFFADDEPEQIVFKSHDYFKKTDTEHKKTIEWLVPNAQKDIMEPVRLTLEPGGHSEVYLPHSGEEFGYVLKGTIKLIYGRRSLTIKNGESFYFNSSKKHYIENISKKNAIVLWITTPPSF